MSSKSCRRGSQFQSWTGHKISSRVSEIPSAPLASDNIVHYINPITRTAAFLPTDDYYHPIMRRYVISSTESVSNSTTNQPKHIADMTEMCNWCYRQISFLVRRSQFLNSSTHSEFVRPSCKVMGQEAHLGLRAVYVRGESSSHRTRKRWRTFWWRSASRLNKWKRWSR